MPHRILDAQPIAGFTGIWYGNQPLGPPYGYKYSGGMATYPQQHAPLAVHRADVGRTYFVFGHSATLPPAWDRQKAIRGEAPGETVCCISYFDHATGTLARPRRLVTRDVIDAHENPVLCVDPAGHLLVLCPAHGASRPSYILRSTQPHHIERFEVVAEQPPNDNFSYPQPWWVDGRGVVLLHTLYEAGSQRRLAVAHSADGRDWSAWDQRRVTVRMARGSYQVSWPDGRGGVGAAFDVHPPTDGDTPLNHRTNLYYMHSPDGGATWRTADGRALDTPLQDADNPALVLDLAGAGGRVYLKDLQYDADGEPVIVYLTAASHMPGPEGGPHRWWLARHGAQGWTHHPITTSSHCYDHGSLVLLGGEDWRLIAPTAPGRDQFAAGGEMVLWHSTDRGARWRVMKRMTESSPRNHTYARRPLDADRAFACLWADGRGVEPSPSSLYFCDADGHVLRMPQRVNDDFTQPQSL